MMVSDGFGPASQSYARSFRQYKKNYTAEEAVTSLDEILIGASRTRSSNSLVTDSAAGATAFSCALKTYNAAVGGMVIAIRLLLPVLVVYQSFPCPIYQHANNTRSISCS
jgi:alkaline phosphatase